MSFIFQPVDGFLIFLLLICLLKQFFVSTAYQKTVWILKDLIYLTNLHKEDQMLILVHYLAASQAMLNASYLMFYL